MFQRVRKTYIKQTCMLKFNEFISKRNSMLFSRHAMFEILFNVLLTTYIDFKTRSPISVVLLY